MATRRISIKGVDQRLLFGERGVNIRFMEKAFGSRVFARGDWVMLKGGRERVADARERMVKLVDTARKGRLVSEEDLFGDVFGKNRSERSQIYGRKGEILPRTEGQREYLAAMERYDVVVCIGPAGTGKTFLAVAKAVHALRCQDVERIILTRPAVEAGERLGFLPGDFKEKVDPYLRPLYDALYSMLEASRIRRLIENKVIEIAPLAYMRGRNLESSFVILDEAQNTTRGQMKMLLTRLAEDSRAVITGDITQIDLLKGEESGLLHITKVLKGISDVCFCWMGEDDIVRHKLVKEIVRAYEKTEKEDNVSPQIAPDA
ncbi:PhoH family protein [candidate division WOR-3 bacterium]|nr:PhoH family protein [candidate division WOR-3 bacterium]